MGSLKEYAEKRGISYEAVRKQLSRYEDELQGHVNTQGRTRYLDEYAERFLDEKKKSSPVVIYEQELKDSNEELTRQVNNLQVKLLEAQNRIIELQEKNTKAIEEKVRLELLTAEHERTRHELTAANDELKQAQIRLQETERELQSFHKTILGFYRKTGA